MAFGNQTFSDIAGAASDLLSSGTQATGLRLKAEAGRLQAQGNLVEGTNYDLASTLAAKNAEYSRYSTGVQETMADRQIYMGLGKERSDIAGSGLAESGSALDLLRDSAQQGALQKELIQKQGDIQEAGYNEQATSYTNLANYARTAASTEDSIANETDQLADTTARNGMINAGIKGAAAVATIFV